jgi:hypothetical protein
VSLTLQGRDTRRDPRAGRQTAVWLDSAGSRQIQSRPPTGYAIHWRWPNLWSGTGRVQSRAKLSPRWAN